MTSSSASAPFVPASQAVKQSVSLEVNPPELLISFLTNPVACTVSSIKSPSNPPDPCIACKIQCGSTHFLLSNVLIIVKSLPACVAVTNGLLASLADLPAHVPMAAASLY